MPGIKKNEKYYVNGSFDSKTYYAENKERLLEKAAVKKECPECGSRVRKDKMAQHKRSRKCENQREWYKEKMEAEVQRRIELRLDAMRVQEELEFLAKTS